MTRVRHEGMLSVRLRETTPLLPRLQLATSASGRQVREHHLGDSRSPNLRTTALEAAK